MKTLLIISIILLVLLVIISIISLFNDCKHSSILQDIKVSQHNLDEAEQKD